MGLNGIHKHAIASISNEITFLCDLYLSMSSLTMWVFDLSSSLDFLSLLFLTKLFTSISKEIYCGHINHRKLFQCCFMIDDKLVKESRFAYSSGLINTFILPFPKDVGSIIVISNVKGIANMNNWTYSLNWHLCQTFFLDTVFSHIIFMLSFGCLSL